MARRAIILGSNGPGWQSPLEFAVTDAEAIAGVLESSCSFEVTKLRPDIRPQDAMSEIEGLAAAAGEADSLVVYFSGHGEILKGKLFLMLAGTATSIFGTALNASHVLDAMQLSAASHKLTILDCCHAGGAGFRGSEALPVSKDDRSSLVLCASDRLEKARELKELRAGFMTHNICAVLEDRSEPEVTVDSLAKRLRRAALDHNAKYPSKRVPPPYLFGEARAPFVLRMGDLLTDSSNNLSNSLLVEVAIVPESFILSVSKRFGEPHKWNRLVSEVNVALQKSDPGSSGLNVGHLVLRSGSEEEFWFSLFDEACRGGHRSLAELVKYIIQRFDRSDPLFGAGVSLLEAINNDYRGRSKTRGDCRG